MNLVDTSGWLEYFFDEPNATFFADPIEVPKSLVVPVVCIYEVFKKVHLVADEVRAFRCIAQMKQGEVVSISEEIALRAAHISLTQSLAMADSFIYATAQMYGAALWTQDADFKGLTGVKYKAASKKRPR